MSLVFSITFAAMIFTGPLEPFRDLGLAMALFGSVIYGAFSAATGSVPGVWWGNQTPPIVVLAIGAAAIAGELKGVPEEVLFATVGAFIAISTATGGLVLAAIGMFGLGQNAKFMPYPVVAGFLATTGVFLLLRAASLMSGGVEGVWLLFEPDTMSDWLPFAVMGLAVMLLSHRIGPTGALLSVIFAYAIGFFAYLGYTGTTLAEAATQGWLLGGGQPVAETRIVLAPSLIGSVDLAVLGREVWTIGAITLLTVLGLVLNVTGLELQTRRSFDLNLDMRSAGIANIFSAIGCGFMGYHSISMYQLSRQLLKEPSSLVAAISTVLLAATLVLGTGVFDVLPKGIFGICLAFLGFEFLWHWLFRAWWRVPRGDYAIIVAIVATALVFDFVAAILLGLLLAVLLFTVAYARVNVVRSVVTGRIKLSQTERSERDVALLVDRGHETLVVELQGYLFFGSVHRIFDRISDAIGLGRSDLRHLIVDFRRVAGMDISSSYVLARVADLAQHNRISLILTGLSQSDRRKLRDLSKGGKKVAYDDRLEDALRRIEDAVLAEHPGGGASLSDFGALLAEAEARSLPLVAEVQSLDAGELLYAQGDADNSLAYLKEGALSAWIKAEDKPAARVASFLPGAVVGEIAFTALRPRTASILADVPSVICRITRASLEETAEVDPQIASRFHALLSRLMAERLGRTTALYFASDN